MIIHNDRNRQAIQTALLLFGVADGTVEFEVRGTRQVNQLTTLGDDSHATTCLLCPEGKIHLCIDQRDVKTW